MNISLLLSDTPPSTATAPSFDVAEDSFQSVASNSATNITATNWSSPGINKVPVSDFTWRHRHSSLTTYPDQTTRAVDTPLPSISRLTNPVLSCDVPISSPAPATQSDCASFPGNAPTFFFERPVASGHVSTPASVSTSAPFSTSTSASFPFPAVAHRQVEKRSLSRPFACNFPECGATFGQKGSLTRHIRSRHEKLRPHLCEICQKSFSALWTLRVHQRNVHLKSKPHKCHLCDKSFGELFNKSKHIAIVHEGKRPFACPICSRAFGYKGDMRKHVLELHQQSGRPFQCVVPSCGVKFARKRYLRRHENLSHKGHPLLANRDLSSSSSPQAYNKQEPVTSEPNCAPDMFYIGEPAIQMSSDFLTSKADTAPSPNTANVGFSSSCSLQSSIVLFPQREY